MSISAVRIWRANGAGLVGSGWVSDASSPGVVVEGNSFLDYITADFSIMCARAGENRMKASARRTLERADSLYLSTLDDCDSRTARARFNEWRAGATINTNLDNMPVFTREGLPEIIRAIQIAGEHLSIKSVA